MKMAISATQLKLFFAIVFAIFLDSTGQIFLNSAGPFTELRSGLFCYFYYSDPDARTA